MNRTFILAGEHSGDLLGAWFIKKQKALGKEAEYSAVGGAVLQEAGATLYLPISELSVVGVIEIIRHLPRLLALEARIVRHILDRGYNEVVLVDFPGFNLRVARKVKAHRPDITITYVSPPQLWVWGEWRVRKLRNVIDRVIVLYPFEVAWYTKRGVTAEFWGSPVAERISALPGEGPKKSQIMVLPGSRAQEIKQLMPFYVAALAYVRAGAPEVRFVFSVASSLERSFVQKAVEDAGGDALGGALVYVEGESEKNEALAQSVCVLTKPGTNTLELALHGVPGVVIYKTSWITYWIARSLIQVTSMTLPNLLLQQQVYPEYIQGNCRPERIGQQLLAVLNEWSCEPELYKQRCAQLRTIRSVLELPSVP